MNRTFTQYELETIQKHVKKQAQYHIGIIKDKSYTKDDLISECMKRVIERKKRIICSLEGKNEKEFENYIARLVKNMAINIQRQKRGLTVSLNTKVHDVSSSEEEKYAQGTVYEAIFYLNQTNSLTNETQFTKTEMKVLPYYLVGYKYEEISNLSISKKSYNTHVCNINKKIRLIPTKLLLGVVEQINTIINQ